MITSDYWKKTQLPEDLVSTGEENTEFLIFPHYDFVVFEFKS